MDELQCSIVVMNGSQPKILRLNLASSDELQTPNFSAASSPGIDIGRLRGHRLKPSTPVSSPEEVATSNTTSTLVNSASSSDIMTSLFLVYEQNPLFEGQGPHRRKQSPVSESKTFEDQAPLAIELNRERTLTVIKSPELSVVSDEKSVFWSPQNSLVDDEKVQITESTGISQRSKSPTSKTLLERFVHCDEEMWSDEVGYKQALNGNRVVKSGIKDATPAARTSSVPPPLCSHCQNKAPVFGKPPRRFHYKEIEEATDMFSDTNFLAEGGFGIVHKGVLRDGQVVAVKQLKFSGSQADLDFCREVRVLSCAQHRNIVLLIGFCLEGDLRILVYEYICNGSLELYLHGLH